ncbi:MmcB family DNA repair protein [Rhodovibrionaceae bacterium A322]
MALDEEQKGVAGESTGESKSALDLARGATRLLQDHGYVCLPEVTLKSGRRVDLLALGPKGQIRVVEIKSSLADFRADQKWPDYLAYCEQLYFAVAGDFPLEVLPADQGLILADAYGGEFLRHPDARVLAAARRKAMTFKFAQTAARRLSALQQVVEQA